jgi:hypothetical protein
MSLPVQKQISGLSLTIRMQKPLSEKAKMGSFDLLGRESAPLFVVPGR